MGALPAVVRAVSWSAQQRSARGWRPPWILAFAVATCGVTLVDAVLLEMGSSYFTSGYNVTSLAGASEFALFAVGSLSCDAMLILLLFALLRFAPLGASAGPLRRYVFVAFGAALLPLVWTALRYDLYAFAGRTFSVALARAFSGPGELSLLLDAVDPSSAQALLIVSGLLTLALVGLRIRRSLRVQDPTRFAEPGTTSIAPGLAVCTSLASLVLLLPGAALDRVRFGLSGKLGTHLLETAISALTDVDRDGYGLASSPRDPDAWNARIAPWAVDVPGNGIDEDGLAGDLRELVRPRPPAKCEAGPTSGARPHLLFIYLESLRADLIGARLDGREVMPYSNRLALDGASSQHAYTHSPWTLPSRDSLFSGALAAPAGAPNLIDDFERAGYRVAIFSGQDDSYGDTIARLGFERADRHYHARDDVLLRTSRSTAPVNLQVSWKTLSRRIPDDLAEHAPDRPLFLFVNLVDTHFPYTHAELDPILGDTSPAGWSIRARHADRVVRMYANTAANVDRAIADVVATFRRHIAAADHAIIVTADHGQSFYENGLLGHGQALDTSQTRVPLILWGIGGDWPEPSAPSDLRELIRCHLGRERGAGIPRARFTADPRREILQWTPTLDQPHRVALRRMSGALEYDFITDRASRTWRSEIPSAAANELHADERETAPQSGSEFEHLIRSWESARAEAAAGGG
jgi:hypothetical protein